MQSEKTIESDFCSKNDHIDGEEFYPDIPDLDNVKIHAVFYLISVGSGVFVPWYTLSNPDSDMNYEQGTGPLVSKYSELMCLLDGFDLPGKISFIKVITPYSDTAIYQQIDAFRMHVCRKENDCFEICDQIVAFWEQIYRSGHHFCGTGYSQRADSSTDLVSAEEYIFS